MTYQQALQRDPIAQWALKFPDPHRRTAYVYEVLKHTRADVPTVLRFAEAVFRLPAP